MWAFPCPWIPATPTRIVSLAPSTRPDDLVPAMVTSGNAALAAAVPRKSRREILVMTILRESGRKLAGLHFRLGAPHFSRPSDAQAAGGTMSPGGAISKDTPSGQGLIR